MSKTLVVVGPASYSTPQRLSLSSNVGPAYLGYGTDDFMWFPVSGSHSHAHADLSDVSADQHHAQSHTNADHSAAGTPSTQAFGDAAVVGVSTADAKSDHKHAMMADPVTAHVAAADPHTGYQKESEKEAVSGYAGLDAQGYLTPWRKARALSTERYGDATVRWCKIASGSLDAEYRVSGAAALLTQSDLTAATKARGTLRWVVRANAIGTDPEVSLEVTDQRAVVSTDVVLVCTQNTPTVDYEVYLRTDDAWEAWWIAPLLNANGVSLPTDEPTWYDQSAAVTSLPAGTQYSPTIEDTLLASETPGGELGGTWASPTVDATHSGSSHAGTQAAAEATAAGALSGHVAAADPHTGYRREDEDHTHASSGAQGGTVAHSALTGVSADQHHARSHDHSNASDGATLSPVTLNIPGASHVVTAGGTGAGLWYNGNVTTERAFLGMDPGSDTIFRLYSAALGDNILTVTLTTGLISLANVTLAGPADPTAGIHVGDRDYNDARYLRPGDPISPAQITADTNDYNPSGGTTAYAWRLSTDASRNLTGIVGGVSGALHLLVNVGSFDLVLVHESASSTAANRFLCPGSANVTLNANDSVHIWYDTTSSRWRVVGL